MTSAPAEPQMIQMSEEALRRLLDDVASGRGFVPPGAFRDENGQVFRHVLEPTGRRKKVKGPDGKPTGQEEDICRRVQRPVYVTNDTSPSGLMAARDIAIKRKMDFYWGGPPLETAVGCPDPGSTAPLGWLRFGSKRERDVPVNEGTGAQVFEMVGVPIDEPDDIGSTSATMQGVPMEMPPDDIVTTEPEEPSTSGLSGFSEDAFRDIPMSTRARKGS